MNQESQDNSNSFFYLLSGLDPNIVKSIIDTRVSSEWILYTFVLPACTVSPLWWRFLQNLRQAYDYRKRWPYVGKMPSSISLQLKLLKIVLYG